MLQNVRIKVSCQNWTYDLHLAFWNLFLCQVFVLFFAHSFQGLQNIELKDMHWILMIWKICSVEILPLWILYKMYRANFWSSWNLSPVLIFSTNFICDFRAVFFKDVFVHNFEVRLIAILGIHRLFPFISDPTWLYLDKILSSLYIAKRVNFGSSGKLI